jgi:hypothetical protein
MDDDDVTRALDRVRLHTRRALEDLEELADPYSDSPSEPIDAALLDALALVESWLDRLPPPEPSAAIGPVIGSVSVGASIGRHRPCSVCGATKGSPCLHRRTGAPMRGVHDARMRVDLR